MLYIPVLCQCLYITLYKSLTCGVDYYPVLCSYLCLACTVEPCSILYSLFIYSLYSMSVLYLLYLCALGCACVYSSVVYWYLYIYVHLSPVYIQCIWYRLGDMYYICGALH